MTAISARVLGEATVQELRESIRGEVITPRDAGYAEARLVWNGAHDRRPALVVRCAGAADVATAVGFARSNDLPIAVRGGGHSIAGFSTCDNGIVIDLSQMSSVRVDPAGRRATGGGGAVWADVDRETQEHGLTTTAGVVSATGVAGLTAGRGITASRPPAASSGRPGSQASRSAAASSGRCGVSASPATTSSRPTS